MGSSFLSAQCVDDPNGSVAASNAADCATVISWFTCDGIAFGQWLVSDECPVSCDTCPADCEANGITSHGCCLPDYNLYITEDGAVLYNTS